VVLLALAAMPGWAPAADSAGRPAKKAEAAAEFFHEPAIRTFQFELSDAALSLLRQSPRSYVTGSVVEAGRILTNVAVRLRGNGSFRSLDDKPNFAVKFDQFATNQTYRGLEKLMFNNSVQDETRLAEFVSTQLFRDAGLPAARVTHARVQLNRRDLGLYVVVEAMNRDFLKRHFKNSRGNLYEGGMADIDAPLQQDSGTPGDQADLKKLAQACALTNQVERERSLGSVLDIDQFISFAAMEMLTAHWDGYVIHTNNFRLYRDPSTDQFAFIPHGMDWTLMRPNLSIQVPQKTVPSEPRLAGGCRAWQARKKGADSRKN
jgi:spore coat protein H